MYLPCHSLDSGLGTQRASAAQCMCGNLTVLL